MCKTYCRVCCIDALSTVSGCSEHIKLTVVHIQMEINFFGFRHNCHSTGRRMDTSAGFCLRDSLYTMYPTLILQTGICSLSLDHKCNFFESTDPILIQTHHLRLPSAGFCVFHIHTINLCCKQSSLITARTCTDLYDNIFAVIRIFW